MITIEALKVQIKQLEKTPVPVKSIEVETGDKAHKNEELIANHARNRIAYFKDIIRYMETNPSEEFVKNEIEKTTTKLTHIEDGYSAWRDLCYPKFNPQKQDDKGIHKEYNKEMHVSKLREQLQNLKFILDEDFVPHFNTKKKMNLLKRLLKSPSKSEEADLESQNKRILKYLQTGYSITPMLALRTFGCFRLSGRIYDLKKKGHNIKNMNDLGGGRYANYKLIS